MKFKLNKISHDRKTLYTILGVMVVFVFALSVAYAVLSATLNISGWAEIASSSWDIHFANANVTNGSVSTERPQLTGSTSLSFYANLANQGDYYEFTVDVVNDGKIDAMVDYIYISPELTEEQRKYLKYEVTYENGQSIELRQNLKKQTKATIRVRIEYRANIAESDLPVIPTSANFYITLVYVQSDGSGVDVPSSGSGGDVPSSGGNGTGTGSSSSVTVVSGDGSQVGDEICIGEECFYVISSTGSTVTMLAKYNLYVGYRFDQPGDGTNLMYDVVKQDAEALGSLWDLDTDSFTFPTVGVVPFSQDGTTIYSQSEVKEYVDEYSEYLTAHRVTPLESRIITIDELENLGCTESGYSCLWAPEWVYTTTYWTNSICSINNNDQEMWFVDRTGGIWYSPTYVADGYGVRPVITISRDLL